VTNERRPAPEVVNPPLLGASVGFSHGILAPAGARLLFVAGQTAPNVRGFVEQFARSLERVLAVVRDAGGRPEDIARMTIWVTDMAAYRSALSELGEAWRARMGRHYPAMALIEVKSLVDPAALVEIEATAAIPREETP
jgi:enamine deaminase RidA (YjgF/YER057c/UK114 family)